jgi:TonB family protein
MKNTLVGFTLALSVALTAPAAERLKIKSGQEDLAYFEKNRQATLLEWSHPEYPAEPGAEWRERAVRVAFEVDAEGQVINARALSGLENLQVAAVAAVSRWKFRPELVDGQPAIVSKEVRMTFTPAGTPQKTDRDKMWPPYRVEQVEVSPPGDPFNSEVPYPRFLADRRLAGEVEFLLSIDTEGRVNGLKVLHSTHPDFLSAALETVAGWKMRPARQGRIPVEAQKQAVLSYTAVDEAGQEIRTAWLEQNGIYLRNLPDRKTTDYFERVPVAVAMVDPVYPYNLALAGTGGAARVEFSVDQQGRVTDVRIIEATAPEFGQSAAAAIAAWRFQPLWRNGEMTGADFVFFWQFKHPRPESVERRLMESLGTENQAVSARSLDRPLFPLFTRSPLYPAARLDALELGEADIEVTIDRDGRVRLPHIRAASHAEFGWAAATAVSQWLFETPLKEGKPADVRVVIPVKFKPPET